MYPGVPLVADDIPFVRGGALSRRDGITSGTSRMAFARPQSARYTSPKSPRSTFSGLMSLCRIPRACA